MVACDVQNLQLVGHVKMVEDVLGHLEASRLAFLLLLQAVVLLSLPFKSCGWDLTDVSFARVTAESTRTPPRWSQSGVLAMSSMTTCNQVAFNLPSATRSNRHEPLAGWYTVVRIRAGDPRTRHRSARFDAALSQILGRQFLQRVAPWKRRITGFNAASWKG